MNAPSPSQLACAMAYLKVEAVDDGAPIVDLGVDDSPVLRKLGHGLLAAYLIDRGESFAYVQHRHLQAAGIAEEELHDMAVRNLASMAERQAQVREYGGIHVVIMGGNFEASLMLVEDFWGKWFAHLAPDGFVVAAPARDVLAFGNASSQDAIRELNALCQRVGTDADHPLTHMLYRRIGSSWKPHDA